MTKNYTPEQHDELAEYLTRMQKGLGHHSWWYTNRSHHDCVDVKIHAWPDVDALTALLTDKERLAIDTLGIDVSAWCDAYMWEVINIEARDLAATLHDHPELVHPDFAVSDVDYGGRSGGWAAVVFSLNGLADYLEGADYAKEHATTKERNAWHKQALAARDYIEKTHEVVRTLHKELCAWCRDPRSYADALREHVAWCIDYEAHTIERKAENLRKLAQN